MAEMRDANVTKYDALLREYLRDGVKDLSPAYFGFVMATGIVSVAADLQGLHQVALALFALNSVAYLVLWFLNGLRVAWFGAHLCDDLCHHQRGPGYFTAVAGSSILGAQCIVLAGNYGLAMVLWLFAVVLWVSLTYTIFTAFTIKEDKPPLAEGITGGWLLAVVATQSIAVLSALLAAHWPWPYRLELNFFALSMWLWGGMLYIWMISLIFYRYTFFKFSPGDLTPPYWINMGAMAISTLAGSLLIINSADAPFLHSLLPFLKGFTVFYWATGTWWIPMLLILGVWRYIFRRFPLRYDPLYWGGVFPIGMYAVSTFDMTQALKLDFLQPLPRSFAYVALMGWLATFGAMAYQLLASSIARFSRQKPTYSD